MLGLESVLALFCDSLSDKTAVCRTKCPRESSLKSGSLASQAKCSNSNH